jgi:predicted nucleic acid-binding protein
MSRPPIFVDSAAWVALMDAADGLHRTAREYWQTAQAARATFLTTDYVLDEAYTLLRRRRNGLRMATVLHDVVDAARLVEVAEVSGDLRRHAWEIFVGYEEQVLSFTDCTSFALMRERRVFEVFTFDADFQRAGFVVRPG